MAASVTSSMWGQFDMMTKECEGNGCDDYSCQGTNDGCVEDCVQTSTCGSADNFCDGCNSILFIGDEGFLVCSNSSCGIIYKDKLDQGAEWRYYGGNDTNASDPTRCGMPINPLLQESSFGCTVLTCNRSSYEMQKVRRYATWTSMPYKEKAHFNEFQRIKTLASNAGIPKVIIDDALIYHKKFSEQKTFRALNRDGIIAASIYISARINKFPRTAKEIAVMFHLDVTSATKGCKNAVTILTELEKDVGQDDKTKLCQPKPSAFIERYCTKIHMPTDLTKLCSFIAHQVEKQRAIRENTPHSIAAGIVFFVAKLVGMSVTKKDVKLISDISEVTINKCYKKIESIKESLVPPSILARFHKE